MSDFPAQMQSKIFVPKIGLEFAADQHAIRQGFQVTFADDEHGVDFHREHCNKRLFL